LSGALAVVYVLVVWQRPRLLPLLVAVHVIVAIEADRIVGPLGAPLTGEALRARLTADVNATIAAIIFGFVFLSRVINSEGRRYGRVHAEVALASEIHGLLVPRIARHIGRFEFRGVSLPSSEV